MPTDDPSPDDLLHEGDRLAEIVKESTGAVQDLVVHGMYDAENIDTKFSYADRQFLRDVGISGDNRVYEAGRIPAGTIDALMCLGSFSIRMTHLHDALAALESAGARPTAKEYRAILEDAFYTSEVRYLKPGVLDIVVAEIDALDQMPNALVPSARCLEILRRTDPMVYGYYTTHWPLADLGGC